MVIHSDFIHYAEIVNGETRFPDSFMIKNIIHYPAPLVVNLRHIGVS
jgi:hypothetical protein